jgi:hypothetical protein
MELNLLLKLLIAHLITDFIIQPKIWVDDKNEKKIKSKKLLIHVCLTTLFAYAFSGYYLNWIIPLTIFTTHYALDLIKSYLKDNFAYFLIDQSLHVLVIVLLYLGIENKWINIGDYLTQLAFHDNFWLISTAYLFVSWPLGIIIGKGTQKWRNQIAIEQEKAQISRLLKNSLIGNISETEKPTEVFKDEQGLGLASAGKWIGICERILILTFILLQQYTAIGFLMTAKSILRFSEKESNTQLKTEYILVGSLVSFTSSVLIGILTKYALQ